MTKYREALDVAATGVTLTALPALVLMSLLGWPEITRTAICVVFVGVLVANRIVHTDWSSWRDRRRQRRDDRRQYCRDARKT